MTSRIEDLLARALLTRERTVPSDVVPHDHGAEPKREAEDNLPTAEGAPPATHTNEAAEAAEDLRALCETLITHTTATDVADFVTDQLPQPRSALALACVLQLTDTDGGARFWWQYAAGAGQPAAAYCLYLHHRALGEDVVASWWHEQTDNVRTTTTSTSEATAEPTVPRPVTSTSTSTILRVLRRLAQQTVRPRTKAVSRLMTYLPPAVNRGYVCEAAIDLPLPGPHFARRINDLLDSAIGHPHVTDSLPARTQADEDELQPPSSATRTGGGKRYALACKREEHDLNAVSAPGWTAFQAADAEKK